MASAFGYLAQVAACMKIFVGERAQKGPMSTATVAILATDAFERDNLQSLIDTGFAATDMARTIAGFDRLPMGGGDKIILQLQQIKPRVVLLSISPRSHVLGLRAIQLVRQKIPESAVFVLGDTSQRQLIVEAMRAGAAEFFESPPSTETLLEGFARLPAEPIAEPDDATHGRIITVVNAKGGCGATTVAVNLAVVLQEEHGNTAVVDLAPIGHAALHLNVRPRFGLLNALENLHRVDRSLLEGLMTQCPNGLHLLAGTEAPMEMPASEEDIRRLFQPLAAYYRYVVVDASSRLDPILRIVCDLSHTVLLVAEAGTVALLWSAARVRNYLTGGKPSTDKVRLVLNRFRNSLEFSEADAEAASDAKLLAKIPSQGPVVGKSVDKGRPVALQENSEVGRAFQELAAILASSRRSAMEKSALPSR
jgi:pilus assembly protein CpaE